MILALALLAAASASSSCEMEADDRVWIEQALEHWERSERELLKRESGPLPRIYAIDGRCTYVADPLPGQTPQWRGTAHDGKVSLPGGPPQPVGPISFAAPGEGNGAAPFFAMSLPSVWREAGVSSGLGVEGLMNGVLLHEIMHVRQFYFANPALAQIISQYRLPDSIDDDSLQAAFKTNPDYVAAWERERDTLYAAAAAADDKEARQLAGEALGMMRARRTRWLSGANEHWAKLDDIFLTMEGLGQWVAYSWYRAPFGMALEADTAQMEVRRKGQWWTQEEGLALFLVIDRLVPDWQNHAFAARPDLAEALLARASGDAR